MEWKNASHDKRELSVVRELGAEAEVIAKNPYGGKGWSVRHEEVDGYPVTQLSTRPLGHHVPVMLNRLVSVFTWAYYIRRHSDADIFSCHDIVALTIAYLSQTGRRRKAKLVYDSHEFEIGRNAKRTRLQIWFITHLERFLIKRCVFSIMVNDSIADEVQKIHKLKQRPVVARNVPPYWPLDPEQIQAVRGQFLKALNAPENAFIVMYHGAVVAGRGIEMTLRAVSRLPDIYAVILGNGAEGYISSLKALCAELGITERVLFHPAVPIEELRNYVGASNAGIIACDLESRNLPNYVYSLPNKLFENIQSSTPVISGRPTVSRLVEQYQIGLTTAPGDEGSLSSAVAQMRDDPGSYRTYKHNLKRAKEELCWENEKQALKNAYQNQVKQSKAVPPKYKYVLNGNDAGSIILETRFVSYYLSLPNKFFENIQSLVPVITGPLPEMRRIVEQYGIGISFRDTDDLAAVIAYMRDDPGSYRTYKRNLKRAKEELCWENEKQALMNAYREILT